MPVETEFKYVLYNKEGSFKDFELNFTQARFSKVWKKKVLIQSYIDESSRIRYSLQDDKKEYFYTFKKLINDQLIEIETDITEKDYDKLFSVTTTDRRLYKRRFEYIESPNVVWSVDFFVNPVNFDVYFSLAEFETSYDVRTPPSIFPPLKNYCIHVDDGTYNLTSYALSNVEYSEGVLKNILENL